MDDFRVGSIPSPDPYGSRRPIDPNTRRRPQHHDQSPSDDEPEDIFATAEAQPEDEPAEDYYIPSDPDPLAE